MSPFKGKILEICRLLDTDIAIFLKICRLLDTTMGEFLKICRLLDTTIGVFLKICRLLDTTIGEFLKIMGCDFNKKEEFSEKHGLGKAPNTEFFDKLFLVLDQHLCPPSNNILD